MDAQPKINDKFVDDDGVMHDITEVSINAFKIGRLETSWLMFIACELYSHTPGTINYWRLKPTLCLECGLPIGPESVSPWCSCDGEDDPVERAAKG